MELFDDCEEVVFCFLGLASLVANCKLVGLV